MKRIEFLKNTLLGLGVISTAKLSALEHTNDTTEGGVSNQQVGFNHLPSSSSNKIGNMIIHKANTRGHANHGWLDSHFSFSFASYYNPDRMNFGALRVLNDDIIGEGRGFGMHPHDNMEIISVPIEGALQHKDNMGNSYIISDAEVQVMSAGTGIYHSEFNPKVDEKAKFLQIWVFTNKQNATPRYGQLKFDKSERKNKLQLIVSPNQNAKNHLWIHQNAWFHLCDLDKDKVVSYNRFSEKNGLYVFVIKGAVSVNNQLLNERDGAGITDFNSLDFKANSDAQLLLMEVPMKW